MRVLTDPAETGAVTLALPQDVQAEALRLAGGALRPPRLARRAARRAEPERARRGGRAAARRPPPADRRRRRHDLRRGDRRAARARRGDRRSPSPRRRPARARCPTTTRSRVGAIGATGTTAANALAREADVVLGVGTRWSDFTTASRTPVRRRRRALRQPQRRRRRRLQARRAAAGGRRARGPRGAAATRSRAGAPTPATPSAPRSWPRSGTRRSSAPTRSATARCPPRAR